MRRLDSNVLCLCIAWEARLPHMHREVIDPELPEKRELKMAKKGVRGL